jgi:hypothetical protein
LLREVMDRMVLSRGIGLKSIEGMQPWEGAYRPSTNTVEVGAASTPEVVAHELGHATAGATRKRVASMAQPLGRTAIAASVATSLIGAVSLSDASFCTADELDARANMLSAVGTASAVAAVPLLAEEAMASAKSFKYLASAMYALTDDRPIQKAMLRSLKLVPNFASYAAPLLAGPILAAQYRARAQQRREQEKVSFFRSSIANSGLPRLKPKMILRVSGVKPSVPLNPMIR